MQAGHFIGFVLCFTLFSLSTGCSGHGAPAVPDGPLNVLLGYGEKDILVIVHVDDLGMHKDETDGGLETIEYGLAKTGSVMAVCPDFARLAEIYQTNPGLDLGIHIALNAEWEAAWPWAPVLPQSEVPSLYNPEGRMWPRQDSLTRHMKTDEAKKEMEAQIKKALDAGIKLTHMDAHMGSFFLAPELFNCAVSLSRKYNLPLALWGHPDSLKLRKQGFIFPDTYTCIYQLEGDSDDHKARTAAYEAWLESIGPGVHELIIHAARVTPELAKIIELPYIRSGDLAVWTSPAIKELADSLGIRFIGFRDLQNLQAKIWGLPQP